ncbi:hypothetical protein MD484_g2693, partial [Candolleomyces efflorescens]
MSEARLRTVYSGSHRKLVLAFDIGTTFSGVSYSILDPGEVPEIKGVTRFPAHEHVRGESKIPTVVYYDQAGNVRAVGAEAVQEGVVSDVALEEGWVKCEWCVAFKFILTITVTSESNRITNNIPPLPPGKTITQVLADFLLYLYKCTQTYIQSAHPNGRDLWSLASSSDNIDYVLSHPNGWEGYQQTQLRDALVLAGLVPADGLSRVSFVTEDYLKDSEYHDDIDHIVRCFDQSTKVRFGSDKQPQYVKFGGTRDNDASCNIRFGQLKLEGSDVASFFEPSISCIVNSVREQVKSDKQRSIKHVILVGGFSSSDWLLGKVDEALRPLGLNVIRPDSHVNKANFVSQLDTKSKDQMKTIDYEVWCYKGTDPDPRWKDTDPGNYMKLCTVQIDTSRLPFTRKPSKASRKELPEQEFWFLRYSCILSFSSGNGLHAQMAWVDSQGIEKRSPANVVYEPNDR